MNFLVELLILVVLVGITNALLGLFLVLRGTSLISFGLAHSILFGIVLAFLFTNSLTSPFLLLGAALTGLLIVILVEYLSEWVRQDVALGLIYLSVFALGIILLSEYAQNTTLSLNAVVAGQLIFSPFIRTTLFGMDLPTSIWILGTTLIINVVFVLLFYKEILLSSFDPQFGNALGLSSRKMNLLLMSLTSLTIVASYQVVGAILVVAFMITPPATALLFSKRMKVLLFLTIVIAITGGLAGLFLAILLNISITGTSSVVYGMIFMISLLIAPNSQIRHLFVSQDQNLQPPVNFVVEHGGQ